MYCRWSELTSNLEMVDGLNMVMALFICVDGIRDDVMWLHETVSIVIYSMYPKGRAGKCTFISLNI